MLALAGCALGPAATPSDEPSLLPGPPATAGDPAAAPTAAAPPASTPPPSPAPEPQPPPTSTPPDDGPEPELPADALGFVAVEGRMFVFTRADFCWVDSERISLSVHNADGSAQLVIDWRSDGSVRGPFIVVDKSARQSWHAGPTFIGAENPQFYVFAQTVQYNGPMRTGGLVEGRLEQANLRITCPGN